MLRYHCVDDFIPPLKRAVWMGTRRKIGWRSDHASEQRRVPRLQLIRLLLKEMLRCRLNSDLTLSQPNPVGEDRKQLAPGKSPLQLRCHANLFGLPSQILARRAEHASRNLGRERCPNLLICEPAIHFRKNARIVFTGADGVQSPPQVDPDRFVWNGDRRRRKTRI